MLIGLVNVAFWLKRRDYPYAVNTVTGVCHVTHRPKGLDTGTAMILEKLRLPYLPMVHCFLACENHRVDLSEGNRNGKNGSIDDLLYTERVSPNISEKDEYRLYRTALKDPILLRPEFHGIDLKTILKAREEGLALLRAHIQP